MAAKILARAANCKVVKAGDVVLAQIEMLSSTDGTSFIEIFRERKLSVWDVSRVMFCFDHFFQPDWFPQVASKEHPKIRAFAAEQGIPASNIFDVGRNGISHQIPVEEGWALPGTVCVGSDTQFATVGAVNTFSLPLLRGTHAALLSGKVWVEIPEAVNVHLSGRLPPGITGKDIGYRLLKDLGSVVNGRVIEFSGPGVAALSIDKRMGVCNCAMQIGAMTMIFPADELLLEYMNGRARRPYYPVSADPDATYAASYDYDLSTFDCLVAGPFNIEHIRTIGELEGTPVTAANIGSCSSGRFEDLAMAASVLVGGKVHPSVRLVVTPISASVMRQAESAGIVKIFADAGAMVTGPGCGSCYSGNLAALKLGDNENCISSSVETLAGRMGSASANIFLANAGVVAASAIEGRIASPRKYLERPAGDISGQRLFA